MSNYDKAIELKAQRDRIEKNFYHCRRCITSGNIPSLDIELINHDNRLQPADIKLILDTMATVYEKDTEQNRSKILSIIGANFQRAAREARAEAESIFGKFQREVEGV